MPITVDSVRNRKSYDYWDKVYEWAIGLGVSHDLAAVILSKMLFELDSRRAFRWRWQSFAQMDSLDQVIIDKKNGWIRPAGEVPRWKIVEKRQFERSLFL